MCPWHALESISGLVTFPSIWQAQVGPQYEAFKILCLQPGTYKPLSYPCPRCRCDHQIIPRHDGTGAVAACRCDPPTCPDLELTNDDITPLEVDRPKLGRALCHALQLDSKPRADALLFTAQIGSWSAAAVPAFLTIQNEPEVFRRVVADLVATLSQPFILLSPTARHLDAHCLALLTKARAVFLPLETTVTLTAQSTLFPVSHATEIFASLNPPVAGTVVPSAQSATAISRPRYALRKSLGVWHLTFDGQEAVLRHERGMFFVAYLLLHPPAHPIHALDLAAKIPEIYRHQLGLPQLADPATGKSTSLDSHARIQERSLSLDDAQSLRAILRKEKELEAILDSEDESEPVKAEALRELEALAQFQRQHGRRTKDNAHRIADTVRKAVRRLHRHLTTALDTAGSPHPVLRSFAAHLHKHLLIPSARYSGHGGTHARTGLAGSLTYEPPTGVSWHD